MSEADLWRCLGIVGFAHLAGIVNRITSETVPVSIEIHADDLDWLLALWDDYFEREWEIHRTTCEQQRTMQT